MYPGYPDPMPAFRFIGEQGRNLLESALFEPQQTYGGRYLYRTIFDKGAALFRSIILNHGLLDGNKRLALASITTFFLLNGYLFSAPKNEAVDFAIRVAGEASKRPTQREISVWLRRHSIEAKRLRRLSSDQREQYTGLPKQLVAATTRLIERIERLLSEIENRSTD